ncbi:hypothetical protein LCGC14_2614410 [marine sediment metagenome]|uniref:Uncharacterized protein n=1 Tax=marine sediment metagenome TaxID=412755 RepID=A0A0F9A4W7_9ZZZZ
MTEQERAKFDEEMWDAMAEFNRQSMIKWTLDNFFLGLSHISHLLKKIV